MYDTKLTSPASMDKYLDDTLEYFKGPKTIKSITKRITIYSKTS